MVIVWRVPFGVVLFGGLKVGGFNGLLFSDQMGHGSGWTKKSWLKSVYN
ncbi:MAG: hypothetical protein LBT86_08825 [Deltaproteobacteria bacterium]|nr:hypothetical protein [Deltaproteobacteria bacterium]